MGTPPTKKICFFIAPIGAPGSEERKRSDQVLRHIIRPAAKEVGYKATRADEISEPGTITAQVIEHVVDDDVVVADLTGWNPNVFYELAIRHAFKKPAILIIHQGQSIPFDVSTERTIFFDHKDLDSAESCRDQIITQIRAIEASPGRVDSPVSRTLNLQSLRESGSPTEKANAELMSMLQQLSTEVAALRRNMDSGIRLGSGGGSGSYVGTGLLPNEPVTGRVSFLDFLKDYRFCPSCQAMLMNSVTICPKCGHDFGRT